MAIGSLNIENSMHLATFQCSSCGSCMYLDTTLFACTKDQEKSEWDKEDSPQVVGIEYNQLMIYLCHLQALPQKEKV